jgi:hypothetical protein
MSRDNARDMKASKSLLFVNKKKQKNFALLGHRPFRRLGLSSRNVFL